MRVIPALKGLIYQRYSKKPSQLQRDVNLQAAVERVPPQLIPNDDEILSEEQYSFELIQPQISSQDDEIPSEEEDGVEHTPPLLMEMTTILLINKRVMAKFWHKKFEATRTFCLMNKRVMTKFHHE